MNRISILSFVVVLGGTSALIATTAQSQVGPPKSYVSLQPTTPGTSQSGNANVSGTVRASQFVGGGAGLTGLPWSSITGAPSSFPPNGAAGGDLVGSYPSPAISPSAVDSAKLASDSNSLAKVSGSNLFSSGAFIGIGTSTAIGSARFVVNQNTSSFGGMYVSTLASGSPFYGYSQGGAITAYSYIDGADADKWKLRVGSLDTLTVMTDGKVGLGNENPSFALDVNGASSTVIRATKNTGGTVPFISLNPAIWARSDNGDGVYGTTDNGYGVLGYAIGLNNRGVYGRADGSGSVGVYGRAASGATWAGYFDGNVNVSGTVSKGGGSFKIDHPLDPANKYLYHSFVESPDMMNIYNGIVTTDARGYATVTMPNWFSALNKDFRYSLTVIDSNDSDDFVQAKVVREMEGNQFVIRSSAPRTKISWMVTGVRQDDFAEAHRIPVEEAKALEDKGYFLYPREAGHPTEMGIEYHRDLARGVENQPAKSKR